MMIFKQKEELFKDLLIEKSVENIEQAKLTIMSDNELKTYADGIIAMGSSLLDDSMGKKFIDTVVRKGSFSDIYKSYSIWAGQGNSSN
jgi:hypothetical protein